MILSRVHGYIGIIGALRPGILLWVFVGISILLAPRELRWRNLFDNWQAKSLIVLAGLACFSIPFGLSIGQAGSYFLNVYVKVLLLGAIIILATRDVEDLSRFIWAYVAAVAVLVWLALFRMDVAAVTGGIERLQSGQMYDSNDLGVILASGFALTLIVFHTSRGWAKHLSLGVLLGVPAVIAITGSRGAFVGLAAVGLGLLVTVRSISIGRRLVVLATALTALTMFAPAGYWDQMRTILNPTEDYNYTAEEGRVNLAKRGLGYMMRYPVFGLGVSNFRRAEYTISEQARSYIPGMRGLRDNAPHNTYIEVGADMGIPALILWLALMWSGTVGLVRFRKRLPAAWASSANRDERFLYWVGEYLPAAFIGFAISSSFVSHAYLPQFYIMLAYLVGFRQAVLRRVPQRARPTRLRDV
jgi:hypothetical protein